MCLFRNQKKNKDIEDRLIVPLSIACDIDRIAMDLSSYYSKFPEMEVRDNKIIPDLTSIAERLRNIVHIENPGIQVNGL